MLWKTCGTVIAVSAGLRACSASLVPGLHFPAFLPSCEKKLGSGAWERGYVPLLMGPGVLACMYVTHKCRVR